MLRLGEEAIGEREDSSGETNQGEWTAPWPQTPREFEILIEALQDRLVRYAYRRLNCLAEAEDVAQEVFVKAYARRMELKGVSRVIPYLYRMTANLCTDRHRRAGPVIVDMHDPESEQVRDNRPSALEQMTAVQELQRVNALLSRLPESQAEVLRLCVLDELTTAEVAEVLGRPVATVKSRLRYGLAKLRRVATARKEKQL